MRYVIVDLEATCWEKGTRPDRMEIIEIGAVLFASSGGPITGEFSRFVRPIIEPHLSDFCINLTSIQQENVDTADTFNMVFQEFTDWISTEAFTLCSWGAYDLNQFRVDCNRHSIELPAAFEQHINLKKAFAAWKDIRPCGMKHALEILHIPLDGTHHRAIDDVRNIAKIAAVLLPVLEKPSHEPHA